jgi:hypothetical protein
MGSPAPAPPPPSESELDRRSGEREGVASRRNDRWVAIVSVVGALLVALVSVIATVWNTNKTADSQAKQSRNDFVRQQEVTAYTQYLAEEIKIYNLLKYHYPLLASSEPLAVAQADQKQMSMLTSGLTLDLAQVEVVGSREAANIAFQIHGYALGASRAVQAVVKCRGGEKTSCSTSYDNELALKELDSGRVRFKNQANHDLRS